ncbi:MAG TPA: NDP-sugar synthase [Acidimicrobiales bacterium]|jgi:mannose-1-phosphate guanylyltransferase
MRAVVLVGGFGTRLRPLTYTTPKPLLPVGHRPILEHVLANLARGGVTEAVLSLGFKPDAFRAAYPDDTCAGVRLRYAVEDEPLDTAGAIRFAAQAAGFGAETILAVNGDVLTDLDVGALVDFHRSRGGEGTIHLTPVDDPSAFGVVPTDGSGRVTAFIEKPPRESAPTNLINAGTYVLEPAAIARIAATGRVSIERQTFPAMVADGVLFALATDDYWLDAGRPEQFLQANLDLLDGLRRGTPVDPIGAGVVVAPSAVISRTVVGARSRVGANARVADSVLLDDAVIDAGAVVERSVLGAGVHVGAEAAVTDAVVGDNERIEAGAALDGVRVPAPR